VIGESLPMPDAVDRVSGRLDYVLNRRVPGMLTCRLLRSDRPHARIARLDTAAAEAVPGVVGILTARDFAPNGPFQPMYGSVVPDTPVVALEKVRYTGEPIAAVAALDDGAALAGVEAIELELHDLPAVFTVEEALADGAPLVHEEAYAPELPANVCTRYAVACGDATRALAEAYEVFDDVFETPFHHHGAMEPHVAFAEVTNGRLELTSATQTPYSVRDVVAAILGVEPDRVRVRSGPLGGSFGAKTYARIEPIVAALAWKTGRPVRLALSREETFVTLMRHASAVSIRTGVDRNGTIVAREVQVRFNGGAYTDVSPRVTMYGGLAALGPYRIPNASLDSLTVYSNLPPAGAFRGYGVLQASWASESQIDRIAERLGADPVELRLRNLVDEGDSLVTGEQLHGVYFRRLLESVTATVARGGRTGSGTTRRGTGCAVVLKATRTPSRSEARTVLGADGVLTVFAASVEMGQGAATVLKQIAVDALDADPGLVRLVEPDTDVTPFDLATSSSRTTHSMGNAITIAAAEVRRQLLEAASDLLEIAPADLRVEAGSVVVPETREQIAFAEVLRRTGIDSLAGDGEYVNEGGVDSATGRGVASTHWHQAAAAAEVEVDLETGKVSVERVHAAVFAGRVVNPVLAELQTRGNIAFGVGQALFEEISFDDGQIVNANLSDYTLPALGDLPVKVDVTLLEDLELGEVHGIGETGLPPVVAAIGNAVAQATGRRVTRLPLTPERVLNSLQEGSSDAA
jgi:CO/xanthine dehydrogenase Mo-binding subunit